MRQFRRKPTDAMPRPVSRQERREYTEARQWAYIVMRDIPLWSTVDHDVLVAEAAIAYMDAQATVEPGDGMRTPHNWGMYRARFAVIDEMRRNDWLSKRDRHLSIVISRAIDRAERFGLRKPTHAELAKTAQTTVQEVERIMLVRADKGSWLSAPDAEAECPSHAASRKQALAGSQQLLQSLPQEAQEIVQSVMSGETCSQIAARRNVSTSAVAQRVRRITEMLWNNHQATGEPCHA